MYDLEIENTAIVTAQGIEKGTIGVKAGRISALLSEPTGQARQRINGEGLYALPGMVDEHVHLMDPADPSREDFPHGSTAAAVGGVTTLIEHTHGKPVLRPADLEEKRRYLEGRSFVDYGLAAHVFPDTIEEVESLWKDGISFFKVFTCTTHGIPACSADDMLQLFEKLTHFGGRALVHAEDDFVTAGNEKRLKSAGRKDNRIISEWRSSHAELVAVGTVSLIARLTGANVSIAHASQPEVVELVAREQERGANLTVETCPQYFELDADEVAEHGALRKFTPPARERPIPEQMWDLVGRGVVDILATDHAPSTVKQKEEQDIWGCPFGLPGIETTLPVLLNGVSDNKLSLNRIVELYSSNPARLLGLYPTKGSFNIGADADIVLVDMNKKRVIRNEQIHSKAGWTPYDGMAVTGVPVMTFLRGALIARDGELVSDTRKGEPVHRV